MRDFRFGLIVFSFYLQNVVPADIAEKADRKNCPAGFKMKYNLLTMTSTGLKYSRTASCEQCAAGHYTGFYGSSHGMRNPFEVCEPCSPGRFTPDTGMSYNVDITDIQARSTACGAPSVSGPPYKHVPSSASIGETDCPVNTYPYRFLVAEYAAPASDTASLAWRRIKYIFGVTLHDASIIFTSDPCVKCPPGFRFDTAAGKVPCSACPPGTTNAPDIGTSCVACLPCTYRGGTVLDMPAWPDFCVSCPSGHYSSPNATMCTACAPGKAPLKGKCLGGCQYACGSGRYVVKAAVTLPSGRVIPPGCEACPAGRAHMGNNADFSCAKCDAGLYTDSTASTKCEQCGGGKTSDEGAVSCVGCAPGRHASGIGLEDSVCTPCARGTYSSSTMSTACTDCPMGSYAGMTGMSTCLTCEGGRYQDRAQQLECKQCHAGTYQPSQQVPNVFPIKCVPCRPGYFTPKPESSSCGPAGLSSYTESHTPDKWPSYTSALAAVMNHNHTNASTPTIGLFGSIRAIQCPMHTWTGPSSLPLGTRLSSSEAKALQRVGTHGSCNRCPKWHRTDQIGGLCLPCRATHPPSFFTWHWWTAWFGKEFLDYHYTLNSEPCKPCTMPMRIPLVPVEGAGIGSFSGTGSLDIYPFNTIPRSFNEFLGLQNYWEKNDDEHSDYLDRVAQCGGGEYVDNVNAVGYMLFIICIACFFGLIFLCVSSLFVRLVSCCTGCVTGTLRVLMRAIFRMLSTMGSFIPYIVDLVSAIVCAVVVACIGAIDWDFMETRAYVVAVLGSSSALIFGADPWGAMWKAKDGAQQKVSLAIYFALALAPSAFASIRRELYIEQGIYVYLPVALICVAPVYCALFILVGYYRDWDRNSGTLYSTLLLLAKYVIVIYFILASVLLGVTWLLSSDRNQLMPHDDESLPFLVFL